MKLSWVHQLTCANGKSCLCSLEFVVALVIMLSRAVVFRGLQASAFVFTYSACYVFDIAHDLILHLVKVGVCDNLHQILEHTNISQNVHLQWI